MTCIVAYKDSEGVVIGSDSRVCAGDKIQSLNRPKWVKYDKFIIAFAGDAIMHNILERLRTDKDFRTLGVQNRKAIDRIVMALRAYMIEEGFVVNRDGIPVAGAATMLITEDKIYDIDGHFMWSDAGEVNAIGSGSPYALGAISALREIEVFQGHTEIPAKLKVGLALRSAVENDAGCGGQLYVKSFSEIRNR